MGNEGSLEGGAALPAGLTEADLSQLSEQERQQISAVMSRAQGGPPGSGDPQQRARNLDIDANRFSRTPGKPPDLGPSPLSKSRTTDTFKPEQQLPGRSMSSMNLRDPKSRTDFKEEQKSSMMPSFLTESNPLSAVTSVVSKCNPFDVKSDLDTAQEEANMKQKVVNKEKGKQEEPTYPQLQQQGLVAHPNQQTGPTKGSSPQQQRGRPTPQQSAVANQESSKPGILQQNPTKPSAQMHDSAKPLPVSTKPSFQQSGPPAASTQQPAPTKQPSQQTETAKQSLQTAGFAKQPLQQQGPVKQPHQQAGPTKQPSQQTGPPKSFPHAKQASHPPGSAKASPPQPGLAKQQPIQQTGPTQTLFQQPTSAKPTQQVGPVSSSPQPSKQSLHQTGPTRASTPQQGPTRQLSKQPEPATSSKVPPKASAQTITHLQDQQTDPAKRSHEQIPQSKVGVQSTVSVPQKIMCPLCTTTELLLHTPEKANFSTCTQCQITVCSMCGFNPNPHITEIKEWLCLNCQMQRALGLDITSVPGSAKQPMPHQQKTTPVTPPTSKQISQPPQSPHKKDATQKPDHTETFEPKMPASLTNASPLKSREPLAESSFQKVSHQIESTPKVDQTQPPLAADKPRPAAEPVSPSQIPEVKPDSFHPKTQTSTPPKITGPQTSECAKTSQNIHPVSDKGVKLDPKLQLHSSHQTTDTKHAFGSESGVDAKTPTILPTQLKEDPKKTPSKINTKPDANPLPKGPQTPAVPKESPAKPSTLPQEPPKSQEQPRRFSLNLGSMTETPKHQPTTPQETVTGKLFGFGASIFSQASSFISTAAQPGSQPQSAQGTSTKQAHPTAQQPPPPVTGKEAAQVQQPTKVTPIKKDTTPLLADKPEISRTGVSGVTVKEQAHEKKHLPGDVKMSEAKESGNVPSPLTVKVAILPKTTCPLCKTELNVGSRDPPNFNTCTECKNIVCNLCGFNPTPHLIEIKEWLCLNCQTQRAMTGQLGDVSKMPPLMPVSSLSAAKQPLGLPSQPVTTESIHTKTIPTLPIQTAQKGIEEKEKKQTSQRPQAKLVKTASVDQHQIESSERTRTIIKHSEDMMNAISIGEKLLPQQEERHNIIHFKDHDIGLNKEKSAATQVPLEETFKKPDLTIGLSKSLLKDEVAACGESVPSEEKLQTGTQYVEVKEKTVSVLKSYL